MGFSNIIVEKKKNGIAKITINRPDALNAVDKDTHLELQEALADIEKDESVRVVVLTGTGRAFSTGGDLKYIMGLLEKAQPELQIEYLLLWQTTCNAIQNLSKPVIAAVNGLAGAGGLELVEACDIAIASEEARLGDQHANYGLVAGGGGTQRLPRLIGIRRAKELLLTGDWLSAKEAEAIGLVNKAVPADKLDEAVNELAAKLAERSPSASKTIKQLVNQGMQTDLATALDLEVLAASLRTVASEDMAEGVSAFLEKRKPVFKGRY